MSTQIQKQMLSKVVVLIQKIRDQLQEVGYSKLEISNFFALKVFQIKGEQLHSPQKPKRQTQLKQQLEYWLRAKQQKNVSIKQILIQLLIVLEIEHGLIIQFQSFEPQMQESSLKGSNKKDVKIIAAMPEPKKKQTIIFQQRLQQQKQEPTSFCRQPSQISLMQDLQQLNESLKVKLQSIMIRQKLMEELDKLQSGRIKHIQRNRLKHIHNMLALQSS